MTSDQDQPAEPSSDATPRPQTREERLAERARRRAAREWERASAASRAAASAAASTGQHLSETGDDDEDDAWSGVTATVFQRQAGRPGRKLLGVDLGERRVGLAVSDDLGLFAFPDQILDRQRVGLTAIAERARALSVAGIVIGLPTTMRGEDGHQAQIVRADAADLGRMVDVPVRFWDERLTTAIADQALAARVASPKKRRQMRDAIAAAIMLQDYLDAHPVSAAGGGVAPAPRGIDEDDSVDPLREPHL